MNPTHVEIYDTTLRDGTQAAGLSPTVADKLAIAAVIDELGVDFIEGGWPGANPKDDEFFRRARTDLVLRHATLVAFGSTCRSGADPADDPQLEALLAAGTQVVCIVGKASLRHAVETLRVDRPEAVRMVEASVAHLVAAGRRVFFDAEHFFDGFAEDPDFSVEVVQAAAAAGAERVVLCDTNGGTLPDRIVGVVETVRNAVPGVGVGVHFHDDGGCAVANSLLAVTAGAVQVQGCVNGYGERCGNADLSVVVPDLAVKMGVPIAPAPHLDRLTSVAHRVAERLNVPISPQHPYVGTSAFAHKAGLHTSALARFDHAYEHVDPATVGNHARMVVSELMGRATVVAVAERHGWDVDETTAQRVVDQVKEMEHGGYQFDAADGSFELLVRRTAGVRHTPFTAEGFQVVVTGVGDHVTATATVTATVDETLTSATAVGDGPVNALDRALRTALGPHLPAVEQVRLTDYRVRDLDVLDGSAARVRVVAEFTDGTDTWGTVGVHHNIVEASWEALVDGVTVGLLRSEDPIVIDRQGIDRPGDVEPGDVGDRDDLALMRPGSHIG